jgi:hypothetical protein
VPTEKLMAGTVNTAFWNTDYKVAVFTMQLRDTLYKYTLYHYIHLRRE